MLARNHEASRNQDQVFLVSKIFISYYRWTIYRSQKIVLSKIKMFFEDKILSPVMPWYLYL